MRGRSRLEPRATPIGQIWTFATIRSSVAPRRGGGDLRSHANRSRGWHRLCRSRVMCRSSDPPDSASARLRRECESLRAEAKLFREQLRKAIR